MKGNQMNLLLVSGKLTQFQPAAQNATGGSLAAVTLVEQRYSEGERLEIKWYLQVPTYKEQFVQRCIERDWKITAFVTDIVSFTTPEWTDIGFMAWARILDIQL